MTMESEGIRIKVNKEDMAEKVNSPEEGENNFQENARTVVSEEQKGLRMDLIPELSESYDSDGSKIVIKMGEKETAHNKLKIVETMERTNNVVRGLSGEQNEKQEVARMEELNKPIGEDYVEESMLAGSRMEIRTEMDIGAEGTISSPSMGETADRTSLDEIGNLEKDSGGEKTGILSIAGKLRDLGAELNVNMVDQFEAFVRSRTSRSLNENNPSIPRRNIATDSSNSLKQSEVLEQNCQSLPEGNIASDSVQVSEQNIPKQNTARGSSKVLDQEEGSPRDDSVVSNIHVMDVAAEGPTVSEEKRDSKNGNSGSSEVDEDLQMAIDLAIARKKQLLAESSSGSGKVEGGGAKMETDCARADCGIVSVGATEMRLTSTLEATERTCGKRARSPDRGEIDGVFKQAKSESAPQAVDGMMGVAMGEDCEKRSTVVKEEEMSGAAMEPAKGEEQELVDADRVVETYRYSFSKDPVLLTSAQDEFLTKKDNFLKGCKWSPDGTCVLTNSDDGVLRLFNLPSELYSTPQTWTPLPDVKAVLEMFEGGLIFDYAWFPRMTSLSPDTCCFASTSRGHPVHMWDAFTGQLRCTYRPHDHMDELISPYSLGFSLDGAKLYCGCNKLIKVFDTSRPGKACEAKQTKGKLGGQTGIISCFAMSPDGSTYAAGSYSKSIGIYNDTCPSAIAVFHGQTSGVTQMMYSVDGTKIYSASRMDDNILCWDVRRSKDILFSMRRNVTTNQRMYFDIDREDRYLVSGNQEGDVIVWDLTNPCSPADGAYHPVLEPLTRFRAHEDTTNGVSIHPWLPLLATASGQRVIPPPATFGSDGESDEEGVVQEAGKGVKNSLKIWSLYGQTPA